MAGLSVHLTVRPRHRAHTTAVATALVIGAAFGATSGSALLQTAEAAPAAGVGQMARAVHAFRAGDYEKAARLFDGLPTRVSRIRDYALYYAGESEFFAGRPRAAIGFFRELERDRASRFASIAGLRTADCLWSAGDKAAAVAAYRKVLGAAAEGERPSPKMDRVRQNTFIAGGGLVADPVIGRFSIAEFLAGSDGAGEAAATKKALPDANTTKRAARAYAAIHLEFPAHPLADEAGRRARALAPETPLVATGPSGDKPVTAATGADGTGGVVQAGLKRAEALAEGRRFEEAVKELEGLPANHNEQQAAERNYLLGMTKFRMRRDYGEASKLLLAAEPRLTGDKAATAAFHGVRALSRVHRDDEAIVGYRRFVSQYSSNRYAAEASFLAGWLDFNRGRYREALPGFEETVRRFPRTSFAADAAWFSSLGQLLLGEGQACLEALDRFARMGDLLPGARPLAARASGGSASDADRPRGQSSVFLLRPHRPRALAPDGSTAGAVPPEAVGSCTRHEAE
jgi:TolA-binding protein